MIKLEAAQRLKAAERSLMNVLGLEGTLVHLEGNSGLYQLKDNREYVIEFLQKKFGKPQKGRKGDTELRVWHYKGLTLVLAMPPDDWATLEISE